jgi:cytochrome c oxidase assembly factor CtaG
MSAADLLKNGWDWEPSAVIGCAALAVAYLVFVGPGLGPSRRASSRRGPMAFFLAAVVILLLDLVSPIDLLGDRYLFSAHIVQHFVLALIVPPLLLLGIPRSFAEAALERPLLARFEREIARPPVSWLLGVGMMIIWHVPALFNAALASEGLHIIQHLSFLVTGVIFWWPVLTPVEGRRIAPLAAISYLFGACLTCSLLGAALTFAHPGLYPAYLAPEDRLGILPLLRDQWGLDPRNDQQLGGLLMWIPGCFVYLTGILATVARWYEGDYEAAPAGRTL